MQMSSATDAFFFFLTFRLAGRSLSKMLKRWPSLISKCVLTMSSNLQDPKAPEHVVLGSCAILATQTILRHLSMVANSG